MGQGFDNVAGFYDLMMQSVFGKTIIKAQTYYLKEIPPGMQKILIIGGGTGWINQAILQINPQSEIFFIEISPKMILQAQKKLPRKFLRQVYFIQGDEQRISEYAPYDVIISNFFLDLFYIERSQKICQLFYDVLNPGGLLLYTDFYAEQDPFKLRRLGINAMYQIAHLICEIEAKQYWNYEKCLQSLPFKQKLSRFFYANTIKSIIFEKGKGN